MLWVYEHYKLFNSFSAGIDFRRQILTTKSILTSKVDPRVEGVKIVDVNVYLANSAVFPIHYPTTLKV